MAKHDKRLEMLPVTLGIAVLVLGAALESQMLQKEGSGTFRVEGEVHSSAGIAVSGAEVEFQQSGNPFGTVRTDTEGRYGTMLPFGSYTMMVRSRESSGLLGYNRPYFSVHRSSRIAFNVTLRIAPVTGDVIGAVLCVPEPCPEPRPVPSPEDVKNARGGNDRFPVPSEGGEPFEASIDYPVRRPTGSGYVYGGDRADSLGQASVAYNLFSLEADKVIYDVKNRTIAATGNVVTADGSGKTQHADSIMFKIENGEAVRLP